MTTGTEPTLPFVIVSEKTVREQLLDRDIHIPLHATRSMERTRQAILQLGAASMITAAEFDRLEKRFNRLVPHVVRTHKGNGAI